MAIRTSFLLQCLLVRHILIGVLFVALSYILCPGSTTQSNRKTDTNVQIGNMNCEERNMQPVMRL
jgi:hypothetical protein